VSLITFPRWSEEDVCALTAEYSTRVVGIVDPQRAPGRYLGSRAGSWIRLTFALGLGRRNGCWGGCIAQMHASGGGRNRGESKRKK